MTSIPVSVHVLVQAPTRMLLLRRYNTGFEDGRYTVPAGHVGDDESILHAACRETLEEAGLIVAPAALKVLGFLNRRDRSGIHRLDVFLRAMTWSGTAINAEPDKCDDVRWFPSASLPPNLVDHVRFGLEVAARPIWFESLRQDLVD